MDFKGAYIGNNARFFTLPPNRVNDFPPSIKMRGETSDAASRFFPLLKESVSRGVVSRGGEPRFISLKEGGNINKSGLSDDEKMRKSCDDFEAILINFLLTEMKKTVKKSGMFGENDFSFESYDMMLDSEIAKSIAESKSFGIANTMYNQLSNTMPHTGRSFDNVR